MKMAESSSKGEEKTLWEKEKLLVVNNFSFSHSVFQKTDIADTRKGLSKGLVGKEKIWLYLFRNFWVYMENIPLQQSESLCNNAKISLTHYQTTNFRLFQTERVCRLQFQI